MMRYQKIVHKLIGRLYVINSNGNSDKMLDSPLKALHIVVNQREN